jgi:hypothetical protein
VRLKGGSRRKSGNGAFGSKKACRRRTTKATQRHWPRITVTAPTRSELTGDGNMKSDGR